MTRLFAKLFFVIFFLTAHNNALANATNWQEDQMSQAKLRLLSTKFLENNEEQQLIALHFKLINGWEIYGPGSQDIGLPPKITFKNPENITSYQILWPQAISKEEKFGDEIFNYSIYKKEVIIPIKITTTQQNLELTLDYGICKDVCLPATAQFSINLDDKIDQEIIDQINKFYPLNNKNSKSTNSNLLYVILLAIIGGGILNIMPCVLPVLSIKLIAIINHANAPIHKIRFAFIATILGILTSFILLSSLAGIIKLAGNNFDWGLQFQNPYFLIFMFLVLIIFTCNLLGIFEISFNQILTSALNRKISKEEKTHNIFLPNFLSGILAVMLATPCSAPFLGSAITFGLTQDISTIFIIFFAIGIGFASPYFLLLISPKLVYLLPKPGNWMNKIKKMMAGFLIATIIWIIYILMSSIGFIWAMILAVIGILIIKTLTLKSPKIKIISLIILTILSFITPINAQKYLQIKQANEISKNSIWQEFSEEKLAKYVKEDKVVIVDITAKWCITCKFNKLRVLQSQDFINKIKSNNIITLRGDITVPNEKIMNYLHKNNRFAIPFNAVYGPKAKDGIATDVVLSKEKLFKIIDEVQ